MTREEAIKRLKEYAQYSYGAWHDNEEDTKAFDMAIEALDAEPVKHGEWKYYHFKDINNVYVGVCECTVCKHREYSEHKYCPNCGAKMDKEKNGNME